MNDQEHRYTATVAFHIEELASSDFILIADKSAANLSRFSDFLDSSVLSIRVTKDEYPGGGAGVE